MCFFETVVEFLADLFDVGDGAGVIVLSIFFCPPSAGVFLADVWILEVCLLIDVAESNKKFSKHFFIAVKSNKSRSVVPGCYE